jgi:hypothetical protein
MPLARDLGLAVLCGGLATAVVATALKPYQTPDGAAAARGAVAAAPLDAARLADLADALRRAGQSGPADEVEKAAGRLGAREPRVQAALFRLDLSAGRYASAFSHGDAILRRPVGDPARGPVEAAMSAAAREPAAALALARRLAGAPYWRADFLAALGQDRTQHATALALLAALRGGPSPPSLAEVAPLVSSLADLGDYGAAYAAWRRLSPNADPSLLRSLALTPDGTPFTWLLPQGGGATSAVGAGRLDIDYDGVGEALTPRQMLVLAPGRYRLLWRELRQTPAGGPFWRLECAPSRAAAAQSTPDDGPVNRWRERELAFVVPAQQCPALWLRLAVRPGEHLAQSLVSYADIRVEPERGE